YIQMSFGFRIHGPYTPPRFSPNRPSAEVSLCCEASLPFTGYRPILTVRLPLWPLAVFALIADVAPLRRFVSEE
ncbi:MAG: hypothetical protein IIT86_11055, partial [Oscillospiraceae bacterium]|nr:hypothetical protein [Oscillospiraceae bacterium]